jgi:diguanylate cyclase (GGDEF)-like protein
MVKDFFKRFYIVLPVGFLIIAVLAYLYFLMPSLQKNLEREIQALFTKEVSYILNNFEEDLKIKVGNKSIVRTLLKNEKIRSSLEDKLSLLITPNIKYIYMLYRDRDGKFRYLLDASKEDKAKPNQKFDVFNPDWEKVFKTKKDIVISDDKLFSIWITYVKPFVRDNKVEALMVVDFSVSKLKEVNKVIHNIKNIIAFVFFFILVSVLFILFQIIKYARLKKKTYIDPLTEVYNRTFLKDISSKLNIKDYIVMAIDIDHFKKINDTYGHDAGDIVLKEITKRIEKNIRKNEDFFIRYGGEEFLVLIKKTGKTNDIINSLAERIRKGIASKPIFLKNGEKINVTISIGVNLDTERTKNLEDAIKVADTLLYEAKRKGRNRIEVYDEKQHVKEIIKNINEIKDAILENRIISYYQPIFDLENMKIVSYEVLARFLDKNGKIFLPSYFLNIIKGTNVYFDFTKSILRQNFEVLKSNQNIKIAINLSILDILNEDILEIIEKELDKDSAERIAFEILEDEEILDYELIRRHIKRIKNKGCKIAIDDFGSGYSNFINILQLHIDYLKIDGSLIKNIDKEKNSYIIVETINHFAKEIKIGTVAEHISNKEILKKVKEIGIKYGQGFYLMEPLPYSKVLEMQNESKNNNQ